VTGADGEEYARHPGLAEPRTKEDWRCYVGNQSPTKPALPAWADYQAMDPAAQRRFNRERGRYHSALVLAWTPPVLHFEELILERLEANEYAPAGARPGLLTATTRPCRLPSNRATSRTTLRPKQSRFRKSCPRPPSATR
jgi:hypothetical protein